MKKTLLFAALACACLAGRAWAQPPADCKPNALNIPSAPYPCILPDNRVIFRVNAPDAQKVTVRLGRGLDMTKAADGLWYVTSPPQVVGFHYYTISIDGAVVSDPTTRTFFGSGFDNSAIEVPEPAADAAYYTLKDVPHGQVSQRWYYSKVTGAWRRAYVYTPPGYNSNLTVKYPVFYLLHGWGENEQGWHTQGRVDIIMDNLIAEKKAKPMIIVMDNLNAVKPGESAALYAARGSMTQAVPQPTPAPGAPGAPGAAPRAGAPGAPGAAVAPAAGAPGAPGTGQRGAMPPGRMGPLSSSVFTEMMLTDLIPMIERTYRVAPGRLNRAMAGLSMGGMQTFGTTMANLDKFAYIGGFSGSSGGGGRGGAFDPKTSNGGVYADAAAFNAKVKVLFLGIGSMEGQGAKTYSEDLKKAGIKNVYYYESPGTAHEWLTWRRCFKEFAPLLFK